MRLYIAAVDLAGLRNQALLGKCRQNIGPDASAAPYIPVVVGYRGRAVFDRAVRPAAPALKHVDDAGDHPPVVNFPGARLVIRQGRLNRSPSFIG